MVRPLEYGAGISLAEAKARLKEVQAEFDRVKGKYEGQATKQILPEDLQSIADCTGVLLPLGLEMSVQDELRITENAEDTVWHQTGQLQLEILTYAAKFENTGVKKLPPGSLPFG